MLLGGFYGGKECISRTDLGKSRSKAHLDMDDGHASRTSMIENTCDSIQKSVFGVSGVDGNDRGLTIHAQDSGVGRIDRQRSSHIKLFSAQNPAGQNCRVTSPFDHHGKCVFGRKAPSGRRANRHGPEKAPSLRSARGFHLGWGAGHRCSGLGLRHRCNDGLRSR
jgi:hypothetical protein